MKELGHFVTVLIMCTACTRVPKHQFTYASPEQMGFSSEKPGSLRSHLERSGASSMMLLARGDVIFDWGDTDYKHTIHSTRKCLLNSLFGFAVSKGIINTTQTMRELEIDLVFNAKTEYYDSQTRIKSTELY